MCFLSPYNFCTVLLQDFLTLSGFQLHDSASQHPVSLLLCGSKSVARQSNARHSLPALVVSIAISWV